MILKSDTKALVVLGGWNANILLNAAWMKRYLFPNEEPKVTIGLEQALTKIPTLSCEQIDITLAGPKLGFAPRKDGSAALEKIEEIGKELSDLLPHTPVFAVGFNFVFELNEEDEGVSFYSECVPSTLKSIGAIKQEQHKYSLSLEGNCTLNLSVLNPSEGNQTVDFNFEHKIDRIAELKALLAEKTIQQYMDQARSIVETLMDMETPAGTT